MHNIKPGNYFFPLILFTVLINIYSLNGQNLNWDWVKTGSGNNHEKGNCIITDGLSNVYVTGFSDSPTFLIDNLSFANPIGGPNAFIAKYDSTGMLIWAKTPTSLCSEGLGLVIDQIGSIYWIGTFCDSITFDSVTVYGENADDIFLIKLDSQGNLIWLKNYGGNNTDRALGICVDNSNNIVITGFFRSDTLDFGNLVLLNSSTLSETFVTKIDSSGTVQWAISSGNSYWDNATGIAVDHLGNIIICGEFYDSSIVFGHDTLYNTATSFPAIADVFILKLDSNGSILWARSGGSAGNDEIDGGVVVDQNNNIYVAGNFEIPSGQFGSFNLPNSQGTDMFLLKLNPIGNFLWAESSNGAQAVKTNKIYIDVFGKIYVTGFYGFSSVSFDNDTLPLTNSTDIFLVSYSANATVSWAEAIGGNGYDSGNSICIDNSGQLCLTGYYGNSPTLFGNYNLTAAGQYDMFVARTKELFTGISVSWVNQNIKITPNPVPSGSILKFDYTSKGQSGTFQLHDITGRNVFETVLSSTTDKQEIQLPFIQAGLYLAEIRSGVKRSTAKVIVE